MMNYSKSKKSFIHFSTICFSIIFLMGFSPESFSESELKTVMIFVDSPTNDQIHTQEEKKGDEKKPNPVPTMPRELPTSFVTGNDYSLNSNTILISSNEGIELNDLLVEQIDVWQKDTEHMKQFWSRTDQVIMGNFGVVNALQNPLSENNYHINGEKYSENINSNLEYFVHERGYDINNLENVPNHTVTPQKYDLSRTVSKQWENPLSNNLDIQHVKDLRDVAPNAFDFTPEQEMQMFRESVKQTSFEVVGSLMPRLIVDESMFLPESDSETQKNNIDNESSNKEKESIATGSEQEEKQKQQKKKLEQENQVFQQTSHIKDRITESKFEPNYATQQEHALPIFEIITSSIVSIATVIAWFMIKKYHKRTPQIHGPQINVKPKYDYLSDVSLLLAQASLSYKNTQTKDAYEKLSQSMRVFYSNKLKLEKEVVTSDIIPLMKNFAKSEKSLIKNSLHLSDMIKFAKHSEDKKQFERIIAEFSQIVRKEKI